MSMLRSPRLGVSEVPKAYTILDCRAIVAVTVLSYGWPPQK